MNKKIYINNNKKCPTCITVYTDSVEKLFKIYDKCNDYPTDLKSEDFFINNSEEDIKEVIETVLNLNIKTPAYRYG